MLEEANGIMHEDLSAQLGSVALAEGLEGSETAQVAGIGHVVSFVQRADIGQVRIYLPCVNLAKCSMLDME